jgi:hypothetical protein
MSWLKPYGRAFVTGVAVLTAFCAPTPVLADWWIVSQGRAHSIPSLTYKPDRSPQLIAKRMSDRDDLRIEMKLSDFFAQAWKLANAKARELGWIV